MIRIHSDKRHLAPGWLKPFCAFALKPGHPEKLPRIKSSPLTRSKRGLTKRCNLAGSMQCQRTTLQSDGCRPIPHIQLVPTVSIQLILLFHSIQLMSNSANSTCFPDFVVLHHVEIAACVSILHADSGIHSMLSKRLSSIISGYFRARGLEGF